MKQPKDYIVFPLDFSSLDDAKKYVLLLADHIGMFKVGLELFIRAGHQIIDFIHEYSNAKIFLDLKLHDIPVTVLRAVQSIASLGIDLTTVHCGENKEMFKAAVQGSENRVGILGVTLLTSVTQQDIADSGFKEKYFMDLTSLVLKRAAIVKESHGAGVVCSGLEVEMIKSYFGNNFIAVTPGIRPMWKDQPSDDQRRITTPTMAIKSGSDYLVIGRPIRDAKDPVVAVKKIENEIKEAIAFL